MPHSLLNRRLSARTAAILTMAVLAFFFAVFTPAYETNDDGLMNYISAGSLTGKPSEFSLFSNFLFSGLLKFFYQTTSLVNWYPLVLYLAQILSILSILQVLQKKDVRLAGLLMFWSLLMVFEYNFLLKLQFTSTAFVVCAAGLLNLMLYTDQRDRRYFIRSMGFFILGSLIRFDAFIGTLIIGAVPLAFTFIPLRKFKLKGYHLLLLLPFCLNYVNKKYYSAHDSAYLQYQQTAHALLDYNNSIPDISAADVGFSQNDMQLFSTYFRADTCFNATKLEKLKATAEPVFSFPDAAGILINYATDLLFFPLAVLLMILQLLYSTRRHRLFMLLHFVVLNLILLLLAAHFKLPHRVYVPALFLFLLTQFYYTKQYDINTSTSRKAICAGLFFCLLIGCCAQCVIDLHISAQHKKEHTANAEFINSINADPQTLFIAVDCAQPYFQPALFRSAVQFPEHNFIPGATFTYSPVFNELLAINGFENLSYDLQSKDVVLINSDADFFKYYSIFMKEHYRINLHFEKFTALPNAKKIIWDPPLSF